MRNTILIIFIVIFLGEVFAKDTIVKQTALPKWINSQERAKQYPASEYFVQFIVLQDVKPRTKDDRTELLIRELKKKVTQAIYSSVISKTELVVVEKGKKYKESFSSNIEISSNVKLFETEPLIYYNKKERKLYGLIYVDKSKLGKRYIKWLEGRLSILEMQITSYDKQITSKELSLKIDKVTETLHYLEQQSIVIIATGVELPKKLNKQFVSVRKEIDKLRVQLNSTKNEELIQKAQRFFTDKKYVKALYAYNIAKLTLPEDERIINGIEMCKKSIDRVYITQAGRYQNEGKFDMALQKYEELFSILPETKKKYEKKYNKLVEEAFSSYAKQLDFTLKNSTIPEIRSALYKLQKYQYIDEEKFNKYKVKVDKAIAEDYYTQAKNNYSLKLYQQCIDLLNKAISYDITNNDYLDLKKKALYKLYRIELKEFKKTQPFTFLIQWGGAMQTNNNLLHDYVETGEFKYRLVPSVSFGVYKKYSIREDIRNNGRDRSKSNIIGFKYIYEIRQYYYSKDDKLQATESLGLNEMQLVVGWKAKTLLGLGVSTTTIHTDFYSNRIEYLTMSLSRRMYMQPFELQMELKTFVDQNYSFYPVLKLSLLVGHNFKRRVHYTDKRRLKYKVKN